VGSGSQSNAFTYVPAPTVTGHRPRPSATTAGGTTVTITGTNFSGGRAVNFAGTGATTYTVVSATQITATSRRECGPVNVTVVHLRRHVGHLGC